MVTAASSSNISPGISRMINTNDSVPGPPVNLEGEAVGSNGILLSWTMPPNAKNIDGYVIRYKEVCPYPDLSFTQLIRNLEVPETLLTEFISGSTYLIQVRGMFHSLKALFFAPGLVTNLTAFAQNHTFVVVTWFLPHRINGLITKFAVKAKYARTGQVVRTLEVNAEDIMTGALPHCNVQSDILSRATLSPLEITASSPPITLSAVPPAASWSVPISVGVDQLRPYTAYLFEVSAFTSDGEGQIASTMVRMPESAPEDPPQNFSTLNMTSRSITVSWNTPKNITGKFTYVLYLYGPTGYLYENNTGDMRFSFSGLTPFTKYTVAVRAKSAGEVGPAAEDIVITPAEVAPSAVQDLVAVAEDSVSIRVSWKIPAQPNGPITHYRLLVLADNTLLQDITLTAENTTQLHENATLPSEVLNSHVRRKRSAEPRVTVKEEVMDVLSEELSYLVSDLDPFTEYTFRVSASTTVGEGPTTDITEKTREQVPSSVLEVFYQNISSTSILVTWAPPLNPNGRITHYSVYGLNLHNNQAQKWVTYNTSIFITDLDKYTGYKLRVAAATAVGESSLSEEDDIFVYTLEDEPDSPPINLIVVDTSPSTTTLAWSAPEKANGVIQYYEVLCENESLSVLLNASTNRVVLMNLKPFSHYNVSVRAYTRYGHGNQTSDTLYLLSGEDGVYDGCTNPHNYTLKNIFNNNISCAEFSKCPPLVPNGVITHYSIEIWNSSHHLNLTSETTNIHITHLRKYAHYRVMVQAHTRVGPGNYSSEPLNITTLEDAPGTPPQFLHAAKLSDYEVKLSWQPPLEANSDILYYIVRVWNETTELWQNVTETSVVVHVDSQSRYNASVSSWTRLGDGGVLIYISFTTVYAEPFDPPRNVTFANVTASSITLLWHPPSEPNGIIVHYTIYYSQNNTVTEQFSVLSMLIIVTQFYLSPSSVPSDSVRNLTAQIFSSTAIIISWDPPLEPNGRPYYLLTLQEAGTPENTSNQGGPAVNKTIKHSTTDTVFLFTKLKKYFPYVLTVTPATGAGPAYNHTSILYLRTDDDIPSSSPLLVSTRNLSSSSIAVVWQHPLEANGEITEYTLTLFGPGGSTETTQTPNTSFILTKLLPYTAYNLTVTAATRKGSGPYLLLQLHTDEGGPMSPPRNLTIYNHTAVSVWLSWEPPLEPSGVVIQYGFRIRDLITDTVTHQNSSGPSTSEYLSGFRPYSSYEISVYSYTRVGHGNQFSSPVTFKTNESVSDAVGNLSCSGVSWDSVQLFWELPENPNGQILFYEITVGDLPSSIFQAYSPEYTVTGLSPHQEYAITVAAVNSAGVGDSVTCTASTLSESVPSAPQSLNIFQATPNNLTLQWAPPLSIPGQLILYHIVTELLSVDCNTNISEAAQTPSEDEHCVDITESQSLSPLHSSKENESITFDSLAKYRYYRFKVAAATNAGVGEFTQWKYARTLAGNPDDPPRDLNVTSTSNSARIAWNAPRVLSGPTSYLVQVNGSGLNFSIVRAPGELTTVIVTNLTAFTRYFVTITAFTGSLENAAIEGKAIGPTEFHTLEEEPKDPPKNVMLSLIPEEVNLVKVTFSAPEEPNGNITAYFAYIYENDQLIKNISLNIIHRENNTLTAFIEGLKGGQSYSIQITAKNGAGKSPLSIHANITTGIKAPGKPTKRPQALLGHGGVAMVTHRSIAIRMPVCFYSDDNGPIEKIQVIVAESGVKDIQNVTNWKNAYFEHPAPYLTDKGFPNPPCSSGDVAVRRNIYVRSGHNASEDSRLSKTGTYVIGEDDNCMAENNTEFFCNGPLKPNTVYVFKFRATNKNGQYTDSEYSDHIKTAVLFSLLCIYIRKKEGGTYSPREAEIIETKCKLDQLIAVADLELKQEKLSRLLSYRKSLKPVNKKSFLQHVEDLCANDNAKFQEEFAELPKLLQDLATTDADLPWNKSKNRFPNIKPYNNNRVKLLSEPGTAGSDYINASFVSGYLCPNEFIATQGPLPGTVADFWRMIWETGTHTIAMLTQCYEKGRIRCHKYWPEDNKPMTVFSDILISKVSEEVLPDWTVRTLKVEKHGHYILVRHFNYTSWPEHGVPESCSTLIKFVKAVRAHRHDNTPIVVHCSAGVGRTGVFIALDHLIQHVRDHDFVDIYGLVAELRSERMCMVQNLAQYIFLHQSMLELLNNKGNSQSIWFVSYSALEKMDSLEAMEGDVELEWEETTM
uniref:Protein-tyrosine-phosphatase n=1 Tax=Anabas testudineus TaxID=64144 RepID=A0A7N6AKE7_ANATE